MPMNNPFEEQIPLDYIRVERIRTKEKRDWKNG